MTEPAQTPSGIDPAAPPPRPDRPSVWTRPWLPYLLFVIVGLVAGFAYAVYSVRTGEVGNGERIGSWETARDFGTAGQSARTRAVIAQRGLMALPASEARYYTARVDDGGRPLTANCTYRLTGGRLAAQFWTVTLYDDAGYLVANPANIFSVGSMNLSPAEQGRWTILASPNRQPGYWLPTGAGTGPVQITLRAYLPADGGKGNFTAAELPSVRREACQ